MTHQTVNGVDRDNDPSIYADDCRVEEDHETFRDKVHSTERLGFGGVPGGLNVSRVKEDRDYPDLNRGISGLKDDAGFVHSSTLVQEYELGPVVYQNSGGPIDIPTTKDLPTVVNEEGGLQSDTLGRFDLIPGESLVSLARVYGEGAKKYSENNWHSISEKSHINHALEHLAMYLMGRSDEPHLDHALCRLSMAVWARHNRKGTVVESGPITFTERC